MTTVIQEIEKERRRQISVEGYMHEHDDAHHGGELAQAAACYCSPIYISTDSSRAPLGWPWPPRQYKSSDKRRDLIKAAALIVAEIERLDRLEGKS